MAPTFRERNISNGERLSHPPQGEEIVITGISGVYPQCNDIYELRDKLLNKEDMIVNRKVINQSRDLPAREGKLKNADKFDSDFFKLQSKEVNYMDPTARILLEKVYETIVDAGYNPVEFQGKNVGVYLSSCQGESERFMCHITVEGNPYSVSGNERAGLANRISRFLRVNGPSIMVDSACSSTAYALNQAYEDIRNGVCEWAIVGGGNLLLSELTTMSFFRLGVLNKQAKCQVFDDKANGYARGEAICTILLQKQKDARRVYATIIHSKTNFDGYKPFAITFPSSTAQQELLEEFYRECHLDPLAVDYVEAHGTGTEVGDPEEVTALGRVFGVGRTKPLPIGSVKSNLGHTETSAVMCSISKVILCMEMGKLLPNLHYDTPHHKIKDLLTSSFKVVTEVMPWDGKLVAVSSFGFGGANAHVLLKKNLKEKKNGGRPFDNIPRLLIVSGRTFEAVRHILDYAQSRPVDADFVHLLHCVHSKNIPGHPYRGYIILSPEENTPSIGVSNEMPPPIWFVFSGLGSQWPGMGLPLLSIPAFASAIKKCDIVLKPLGVDIFKIITEKNPEIFNSPMNAFVGVAALQIGLVNILTAIGVIPDGVVGHSIGDLLCAYVDGTLSLKQTILVAYYRGLACNESTIPRGSLAMIGKDSLGVLEKNLGKLEIVSTNSSSNYIIAGSPEDIDEFSKKLRSAGKYVRVLNCGGIACHSKNLAPAKSLLLNYLQKVIPDPKTRSNKWAGLSVPHGDEKLSSAEYHAHCLLSPATFLVPGQHVPSDVLSIEISPSSLLSTSSFTLYNEDTGILSLLSTLGKLYNRGINMDLGKLYPAVEYPVSRGTPMISPLIKWNHSNQWFVPDDSRKSVSYRYEQKVTVDVSDPRDSYFKGHNIDGRNLFPATGYLYLAWEMLAQLNGSAANLFNVHFKHVRFNRATHIPQEGKLTFLTSYSKSSGKFEVIEGGVAIVSGYIYAGDRSTGCTFKAPIKSSKDTIDFSTRDIYKELKLRGYNYSGLFRSLLSVDQEHTHGELLWQGNWIAFMDNLLQMIILALDSRSLYVPTYIKEVSINTYEHQKHLTAFTEDSGNVVIPVSINKLLGVLKTTGVEVRGIRASPIARRKPLGEPVLESYQFVPYSSSHTPVYSLREALTIFVQVLIENSGIMRLNIAELPDEELDLLSPLLLDVVGNLPLMQAEVKVFGTREEPRFTNVATEINVEPGELVNGQNNHMVVISSVMNNEDLLKSAVASLHEGGCIIAREKLDVILSENQSGIDVVADYVLENERILMLKKRHEFSSSRDITVIQIREETLDWLPLIQAATKRIQAQKRIYLVAQQQPFNGILGFFNCLYKELNCAMVRCVFTLDKDVPSFDPTLPFYYTQLDKDLAVNVFKNGQWGSYRHLLLDALPVIDSPHAYNHVTTYGDLSSMTWLQGREKINVKSKMEDVVHVYYAALNFKDVMLSSGRLSVDAAFRERIKQDCVCGFEFTGRTSSGKRVMGMTTSGAIANVVKKESPLLTWEVPDSWSLEDAATVPVVYATVLYAFVVRGHIKRGESVLIHSGTGGIGLSAINVALHYGLTIFTTVGTKEKREYIREHFPEIPDSHIGNSRDTSFEQMVMRETGGKGVDLVLNSLAEEKLVASLRCLADGGRFLEIGKFDLTNNTLIDMEQLMKNKSYHGVMLDTMLAAEDDSVLELHELMTAALKSGTIKPLKMRTCFSEDEVEQAYRFMAAGKHMGKVLIKIRDEEDDKLAIPTLKIMKARPRYYCNEELSYIVTGGLGGFGLELADWLVCRGAKNLVLTSRKGIVNGYQCSRVCLWKKYGVNIVISKQDISTYDGVKQLISEANKLAPVGGIFNLAVLLQDALFENQSADKFTESAKPKSIATHHLDVASRQMCPHLEKFVVFSSVSCGRGNVGQTNYGMSNSVMERICEARVRDGLPGLAIQWGAIGEVGLVADMQEENRELVIGGTLQQSVASCLKALDYFLQQPLPVVASMVVAEKRAGSSSGNLSQRILGILGMHDISKIRPNTPLGELGMDSMTGVEIKQVLEQEFEVFLTPVEIRELTVQQLENLGSTRTEEVRDDMKLEEVLHLGRYLKTMLSDERAEYPTMVQLPSLGKLPDTVFLIPGTEGLADTLSPLSVHLNSQTVCLQMFSKECGYSIKEMAKYFFPLVKAKTVPGSPVHLVGFSLGGVLALELTAALEQEGYQCKLVLIDSAPDLMITTMNQLMEKGEQFFQIQTIMYFADLLQPIPVNEKQTILEELKTKIMWGDKLDWLVSKVAPLLTSSPAHIRTVIDGAIQRCVSVPKYSWDYEGRLKAPVMLLRPILTLCSLADDDFGLSKFCERIEAIHVLEGDHSQILGNPDTSKYINEFLGNEKVEKS
ncbi:fatty acid synthase [Anabrus simplex]|uniref:fatty acid synthase n=1 Tax=Anabrus simplex TaxID=316456 RepID=UPI0035A2A2E4